MRILLTAIYPYIFLLLYIIIPFDEYVRALPNILMTILVISFPFVVTKKDLKKLLIKPTLLFLLFFAFLIINSFFQGTLDQDFNVISKMLIPIGLVFLYLPVNNFKKLNKAIIFSSFSAIVFTLFQFLILVNQNDSVSIPFFQETVDALLIDRIYVGLLCVISILISYKSITKKYHPDNRYYLVNIIVSSFYLLLIMSKTALIILFVIVIVRQFYGKPNKIRRMIAIGTIVLITGISLIKFQPFYQSSINLKNDLSKIDYNESTIPMGYRAQIWDCALKISKESSNILFGIGFRETTNKLVLCYNNEIKNETIKQKFISKRFNTHNQFMDFYISAGLISLLLFLGVLITLFIQNKKQFFPTALLITIFLFGLVENFFHRQIGAYYFGFILAILFINNTFMENSDAQEKSNKLKEN